jgi:hypothetical protein
MSFAASFTRLLKELGIEQHGFHSFRRFRVNLLESSCVPSALVKYGTGLQVERRRSRLANRYRKLGTQQVSRELGAGLSQERICTENKG